MASARAVIVEPSCSYTHCPIGRLSTKNECSHLAALSAANPDSKGRVCCLRWPGGALQTRQLIYPKKKSYERRCSQNLRRICVAQAAQTSESWPLDEDYQVPEVAGLDEFFKVNSGKWTGTFMQFDSKGTVLQSIPTKMAALSYGEGVDAGLLQRLSVKEALAKTRVGGEDDGEIWKDYKFAEMNSSTVGRQQQLSYFPGKGAFSLSHQTSEMLSMVIRTGVLGEDDDEENEAPRGVKLPSRRPALVTESCLYSTALDQRVRVIHVLDSQGLIDMFGVFREARYDDITKRAWAESSQADEPAARVEALLGEWQGHSVTRRSVLYGSTVTETPVVVTYRRGEDLNTLVQEMNQGGIRISSSATIDNGLLRFDKGLCTTLLPRGMSMSYPTVVSAAASFYFEASWMNSPTTRQRLVRTYDVSGQVVSATLSIETKQP
eukprot:TRINITY_DN9149_c0_g1_i1.p1 TRINITY_DN9149_c0_g1~~TRINITY_DN9149_c0_g1_i1.p1  ORF type:complete len:435 (-),score=47.27 TRINITY_DN9149_c0_g1_i1:649-1953(-)